MENKSKMVPKFKNGIRNSVKTLTIILLLLIQVAIYVLMFLFLSEYAAYLTYALYALGIIVVIFIFSNDVDAYYKLSWTLLILCAPTSGSVLYLIIRNQRGPKRLDEILKRNRRISSKYLGKGNAYKLLDDNDYMKGLATYTYNTSAFPIYSNCDYEFYPLGENFFEGIMREIRSAKEFIFLEFFIIKFGYMWPSILEVLKVKAAEGVEVRVMYDGFNTLAGLPHGYDKEIESYGIKCRVFSPITPKPSKLQNNRDHRKILVVDGKVAFTGGNNLADEYMNKEVRFGHWKDISIMVRGEAVKSFTMMFLEMWNSQGFEDHDYGKYIYDGDFGIKDGAGFAIPYGYSPVSKVQIAEHVYLDIIYNAKKYLHIMTPYLVLTDEIKTALIIAASRGVDVKIIIPHIPDKKIAFAVARSFYPDLVSKGVKIYEYEPGFVHAKEFIVDDETCTVGTVNLDYRSVFLHFECGLIVNKNKVVLEAEEDFEKTLKSCIPVDMDFYKSLPIPYRILGKVFRVTGPLL